MALTKVSHWAKAPFLSAAERQKSFDAMELSLAETLCEHLGQLRGTAAKLGQILAMESGLVSEKFAARLQTLQHATLPLRYPIIRKIIERDFGRPPETLFREFAPESFAAASLGQVHRAVLPSGEDVAVKILFPGVEKSVTADFALVRALVSPLQNNRLFMRTLDEMRSRIMDETDYRLERANMEMFAGFDLPIGLRVPKCFGEFSSRHVLTSEYLPGEPFGRSLPTLPEDRNRAGQMIFDFFKRSIFEWKVIHADPHAGNYLWLADGRQLGLVDFGAVKKNFSPDVLELFHSFFIDASRESILDLYERVGARIESRESFYAEVIIPYRETVQRLLGTSRYTFSSHDDLARQLRVSLMSHAFHPALQDLSSEFTFLHRTFYGVLTLLTKLEATIEPGMA